ncbi:ABC transporter ATP-binding protein [Halosimplex halophilum]|uniref:ABC transporter ATP-binding protein n=1 Tax=Halosimplex halophilum TaxID=2559572 RepID=UPI00107F223E|nr:ABC transporter ATP-binding protein [Halosimplex halophilum]
MPAIETTALTKRYGDVRAVEGLDLAVDSGEVFGFLGPNGAGKSTTIDLLLGFRRPTEGSATVLGHDATAEARAVRARTGLLPEGCEFYENLTARDHVRSAVEATGADDDPDAVLDRVGLDPGAARRPVGGYSTGMTQRLALAVALVGEPDLLVLDEPSSGLDPSGIRRLREIVREEAARGATVFFSSHILGQVEQVCDRVGIMAGGELVAVDAIDDLRAELGANEVLDVTVAEPPEPSALDGIDGVADVTVDGDTVRAECSRPEAKAAVVARLTERTRVRDFGVEDVSLESVFDEYTSGTGSTRRAAGSVGAGEAAVEGDDGSNRSLPLLGGG